jgi:broad specificity phosphatase PhoE
MKTVELFRHTANEGDRLTAAGIKAALNIGATLPGGYAVAVSSGAQRATQTVACLLAGLGEKVSGGVVVIDSLRSAVEEEWRSAYQAAGAGDIASLRRVNPDLVERDSAALAAGLRAAFALLPEDGRALAVGHSPTNEAAIYGLTGVVVEPVAKGGSVVIAMVGDGYLVDDR